MEENVLRESTVMDRALELKDTIDMSDATDEQKLELTGLLWKLTEYAKILESDLDFLVDEMDVNV